MLEEVYLIEGMSCAACSSAVERVTRKLEGVERSDVNLTTNKMIIYYDESKVDSELIMAKVKKAGFGISLFELDANDNDSKNVNLEYENSMNANKTAHKSKENIYDKEEEALKDHKINLVSAAVFTVILLYISMGPMLIEGLPVPSIIDIFPGT